MSEPGILNLTPPHQDIDMDKLQTIMFRILYLILPVALFPVAYGIKATYDAEHASSWPLVNAEVITSDSSTHCSRGCVHLASILYRYHVAEHEYQGSRLYFGDENLRSQENAEAITREYPPGRQFPLFVNPDEPTQSVILAGAVGPGTWPAALAAIIVYGVMWLAGLLILHLIKTTGLYEKQQLKTES
jgi:hypothetical protein